MRPKIYIETTIVSYLVARPSRDVIVAAHQQITDEWWTIRREDFDLFASQLVWNEAGAGDPDVSGRRLAALEGIELLQLTEQAASLATNLIAEVPMPANAGADAIHIAIAVTNGMSYLLTWNCTHLANASIRNKIDSVCRSKGFEPTTICTPEELLEV